MWTEREGPGENMEATAAADWALEGSKRWGRMGSRASIKEVVLKSWEKEEENDVSTTPHTFISWHLPVTLQSAHKLSAREHSSWDPQPPADSRHGPRLHKSIYLITVFKYFSRSQANVYKFTITFLSSQKYF